MHKITWGSECYICKRPIRRGRPTLLFATDRPALLGVAHSTCSYKRFSYARYQMCPPDCLSAEDLSFLVHYFPKLYSTPGGQKPNRELRLCLAELLWKYPSSVADPLTCLQEFKHEHKPWPDEVPYQGDLETDFLRVLGQIQESAKAMPEGIEPDFRK